MELLARHALSRGRDLLDHFPITIIQGARQVGKSTLAAMLTSGRSARSFTLDDPATLHAIDYDPVAFVEQHPSGLMVIDEVQQRPELLRVIKANVDRDRRPGRFLLTGSADVLRLKGETDSLAGRAVTLRLRGLSQGELLRTDDDFVQRVINAAVPPLGQDSALSRLDYVETLGLGGFPELRTLPQRLRRTWLDSYLDRVLERDAVTLPGGSAGERLRAVARLLAANQAGELVKARIADQAQVPQSSITTYLDALAGVFLTEWLPSWSPNLTRREVGRPKTMIADSALALRLSRLTPQHLEPLDARLLGGFLEGFVASELLKQQGWSEQDFRLFHYRDRNGREVDIVLELDDGSIIGIEVKAATHYKQDHFHGLAFLKERLGDRMRAGVVLTTSKEAYLYGDRLWGLPLSALWTW